MAVLEFDSVLARLASRTEKGRLSWKPTYDKQTFIATLEGYTFEVSHFQTVGDEVFSVAMKDASDNELVRISARNREQYDPEYQPDDRYFARIRTLHEEARQSALDVPKKLTEIEQLLDRD